MTLPSGRLSCGIALYLTLTLGLAAGPARARAPAIPKDVDGFTAALADRFASELPDAKVKVRGPLVLAVTIGGETTQLPLDNAWEFCGRDRRKCAKFIKEFVTARAAMLTDPSTPVKATDVRAIVRDQIYIDEMRRAQAGKPDSAGIVRPLVGRLWLICVIDHPNGVSTMGQHDLVALGLSEDQAIRNLSATLKLLVADTKILPKWGVKMAAGDFYEASRMLLHDDWAAMSKAAHGNLMVAVPETHILIYGDGGLNGDRAALRAVAEAYATQAPKPISPALYHWTETGWEAAAE
jgi:hypothetical protein